MIHIYRLFSVLGIRETSYLKWLWHQSAVTLFVICLICFVSDGPIVLVFNNTHPNFHVQSLQVQQLNTRHHAQTQHTLSRHLHVQAVTCFTDRSKAVLLLWIRFFYLCLMSVFVMLPCLFIVALWSYVTRADLLALLCVIFFIFFLSLFHMLPRGSGVEHACIDSWYLPSLLCINHLLLIFWVRMRGMAWTQHDSYTLQNKSLLHRCKRFPTKWQVRQANPQISLRVRAVWSEPLLVAWVFYDC